MSLLRLLRERVLLLVHELGGGNVHLLARELVDLEPLHDRPLPVLARHRERVDLAARQREGARGERGIRENMCVYGRGRVLAICGHINASEEIIEKHKKI
jgi:hypothetical protein